MVSRNRIPMQLEENSGKIWLVKTTPVIAKLKDAYNLAFGKRVYQIRRASEKSRQDVAAHLGITYDTYRKYESSPQDKRKKINPMPHCHIPMFLDYCNGNSAYLMGASTTKSTASLQPVD